MSREPDRRLPDAGTRPEVQDAPGEPNLRERIRDVIVLIVRRGVECILFLYDEEKNPALGQEEIPKNLVARDWKETDFERFRQAFFSWSVLFTETERADLAEPIEDLENICREAAEAFSEIVSRSDTRIRILDDRSEFIVHGADEPHSIVDLFKEPIEQLPAERLQNLPTKAALYNLMSKATERGVKMPTLSLLPYLAEAIESVKKREIQRQYAHEPDSDHPQRAMRDISEYERIARFIAQALESRASEQEGRLLEHPHHHARRGWERRIREMADETLLPGPEDPTEELILGALKRTLPRGMRLYDLFDNSHYLWGRICSSDNQEGSLLEIVSEEKLSMLLEVDHEVLRRIHQLKPFIQLLSVPSPTESFRELDPEEAKLLVLVNRVLLMMKPFAKEDYYQRPAAPEHKKAPEGAISHDDCWLVYQSIRDAFRQAKAPQEVLDLILPGVSHEYLQCPEDPEEAASHGDHYTVKRLRAWAREADIYFRAIGRHDIALFLLRFFDAVANEPQKNWEATKLFHNLHRFSLGLPQGQDEDKRRERVMASWRELQTTKGMQVLLEPDCVHEAAKLLEPMRKVDSELRTIIWGHLSKNYPRLLRSTGTVVYQASLPDPLPAGPDHHVVVRKIGPQFCVVTLDVK